MNEQQIREVMTAWLDGKEIEADATSNCVIYVRFPELPPIGCEWRIKQNYPPRPTDEQLLDWGVRIVGDEPRVPKAGERYVSHTGKSVSLYQWGGGLDAVFHKRRWIVEHDPYAEARKAWRDDELQYMPRNGNLWINWTWPRAAAPAWTLPPEHYRRKPKEPQGKWVECEVREVEDCYLFTAPNKLSRLVTDAPSIKGFGGYLYDGRWSLRMKSENNPPTNGAVTRKPEKVRFWAA